MSKRRSAPSRQPSQQRQRQNRRGAEDHQFLHQSAQNALQAPQKEKVDRTPIRALNERQKLYIEAIKNFMVTLSTGCAGTGKTWVCTALAADMLDRDEIDSIVITRPAVEAGENLGFLPGELENKFDPYLQPFRDVLNKRLGKSYVDYLIKAGKIEAAPLAYMRGRTFTDTFVILDEAQNTTPEQMKMFLTRIGQNCKVVVNGDTTQKDIRGASGLQDAVDRISWIPSVKHIHFNREHVVRSGFVQEVIESYERDDE